MDRIRKIEAASIRYLTPLSYFSYMITHEDFIVAEIDGEVIGYVLAIKRNNVGHVLSTAVDPRYRRRGVGTALMLSCLENLEKRGVKEVRLLVWVGNPIARRFYSKLGFKAYARVRPLDLKKLLHD